MTENFHDCYGILKPRALYFLQCPYLTKMAAPKRSYNRWSRQWEEDFSGLRKAYNLAHATLGQVTMRMLDFYRDGKPHHYSDVCKHLGFSYGTDIDCWNSLRSRDLIANTMTTSSGKKFYTITENGREVLSLIDANHVYFRVARWFKIKGEDVYTAMVKSDINGTDAWEDLMPQSIINMLDSLFYTTSRLHQIGSVYRWMNNIMYLVKTSSVFREKLLEPEVVKWMLAHKDDKQYYGLSTFISKFNRTQKRLKQSLFIA